MLKLKYTLKSRPIIAHCRKKPRVWLKVYNPMIFLKLQGKKTIRDESYNEQSKFTVSLGRTTFFRGWGEISLGILIGF